VSMADHIVRAPSEFIAWLRTHQQEIVEKWISRARSLSPHYQASSQEELHTTISRSFEANRLALESGSAEPLIAFVDFITELRLRAGFPLSAVQKAFDLYRIILTGRVLSPEPPRASLEILEAVNSCVSYQIHRFSDQFQLMHEEAIRAYAENLEEQVRERTEDLAASERRYKTLVEEINDGYFVLRNEKFIFANRAFCKMHGATPKRMLGERFDTFVAEKDRRRVMNAYLELLDGHPTIRQLEYKRIGASGLDEGDTEIKAKVVDLGASSVTIGICRDITERVEMEKKVREHERMAYVGQLTASLSHEIRNPLSAVKMNMQILSRKLPVNGFDRRRLDIVTHEVTRLESILRQLLDLAKTVSPSPTMENINEIINACMELLDPKLREAGIEARLRLDASLPPAQLDRGMIEQALMNLLLNAIEALSNGGVISVSTGPVFLNGESGFEICIEDNGIGIKPESMDRIFTPFFSEKRHGTGLGLTNVKRIVEAHKGRLLVQSEPGNGARFRVQAPISA